MSVLIAGKTLGEWLDSHPLIGRLMRGEETFWPNDGLASVSEILPGLDVGEADVRDAAERLERFAPYIAAAFPGTREAGGIIESPLAAIPETQQALAVRHGRDLPGRLLLKCDHLLPISGSIKARGGIYEVLKHAETLALEHGLLSPGDDYALLDGGEAREFFGGHSIAVGSTGNLGLSIGIMGARLGFRVAVHMSADARQWKKDMLRAKGVEVVEHSGDYGQAVATGRAEAEADPGCHFVDDENSRNLFLGYAVAAGRLKRQLDAMGVRVDSGHPLLAYLPCGVGGGPGGVAFGLKLAFGDDAHCFFAEPTHSPGMFLGVYTGRHDEVCVQDFGIDNVTEADGLAVGRPSGFVGKRLGRLIDGFYTVSDETMYRHLALLADSDAIRMEPSALAGLPGMARVLGHPDYLAAHGLEGCMEHAVHVVWGTGGAMVPGDVMDRYYKKGSDLLHGGRGSSAN